MFRRPKNRKRLQWHGANGKFAKTPSIEDLCGLKVFICPLCGQMHPVSTLQASSNFTVKVKPEPPATCANCGKEIAADEWQ